ncbi:MAG: thioredoxin [Lachnospiraceae bacterium]
MTRSQKNMLKYEKIKQELKNKSRNGGDYMSVVTITAENFEKEVLNSTIPVLVDFWAVWCGPCQMQGPVIEQAADKFKEQIKVTKLNVDEVGSIAQQYGVMSIPTLILFQNGQVKERVAGFHSLEGIAALIA